MSVMIQGFVTCPRGLESVLADELAELGVAVLEQTGGGVAIQADWLQIAQVNRSSRIASRVMIRVGGTAYSTADDLYSAAKDIAWDDWFGLDDTFRVGVTATGSKLKSLEFATLKIKDAICDRFREKKGARPNVSRESPHVRVYAYLTVDRATFYLDTSGDALFKRGYRTETGDAPLRENLAAGILRLTGWRKDDPEEPLFDPMCGSGTFLIEAAAQYLGLAPGRNREFGFSRLRPFPHADWKKHLADLLEPAAPPRNLPIYGSDVDGKVLRQAEGALRRMGLLAQVRLTRADVRDAKPPVDKPGVWITNPPYGVRMGESIGLNSLYPQLGDVLKTQFAGWRAFFITGDPQLDKTIRLSSTRRTVLFNGALECRLLEYPLVAGSMRGA